MVEFEPDKIADSIIGLYWHGIQTNIDETISLILRKSPRVKKGPSMDLCRAACPPGPSYITAQRDVPKFRYALNKPENMVQLKGILLEKKKEILLENVPQSPTPIHTSPNCPESPCSTNNSASKSPSFNSSYYKQLYDSKSPGTTNNLTSNNPLINNFHHEQLYNPGSLGSTNNSASKSLSFNNSYYKQLYDSESPGPTNNSTSSKIIDPPISLLVDKKNDELISSINDFTPENFSTPIKKKFDCNFIDVYVNDDEENIPPYDINDASDSDSDNENTFDHHYLSSSVYQDI